MKILLISFLFLQSCSTINYRFEGDANGQGSSQWHHMGLYGAVNYSDVHRARNVCPDGVSQITTRKGPLNVLLSLIPYIDLFWSTAEVKFECSDKMASNSSSGNGSGNSGVNGGINNSNQINININGIKQKEDN